MLSDELCYLKTIRLIDMLCSLALLGRCPCSWTHVLNLTEGFMRIAVPHPAAWLEVTFGVGVRFTGGTYGSIIQEPLVLHLLKVLVWRR